jgi:hypothetical protein
MTSSIRDPGLDLALGDLEGHLGHVGVVLGRLIEGRADHLAFDAAAHVGDLLRSLADQGDHEQDLWIVRADPVRDVLEEHRLAGLRGADDEGALAFAERVHEVDQPLAEVLRVRLDVDQLVRVDGGQVSEDRPVSCGIDVDAVDGIDAKHPPVLLGVPRSADGAADPVTDAQAETADLARADVDIVGARQETVPAHEPEAFVDDVEDASRVVMAGPQRLALEDPLDQIVLALLGAGLELQVAADLAQLRDAHLAEVGDVEIVPLAGGFELLHLVVFGDRRAGCHLRPASRPAIPLALIWTELGHGIRIPSGTTVARAGHRAESLRSAGRVGIRGA